MVHLGIHTSPYNLVVFLSTQLLADLYCNHGAPGASTCQFLALASLYVHPIILIFVCFVLS